MSGMAEKFRYGSFASPGKTLPGAFSGICLNEP